MGGGLMQLVAYGAQDIYLTGNPQITFFKVVYRRHTNFSVESIEQTFNGTADFGKRVTATISRNGDLVSNVYLQIKVPALTQSDGTASTAVWWTNGFGNAVVKNAEVEIGGQRIDKHYAEWMDIWGELNVPGCQKESYDKMVGNYNSTNGLQLSGNAIRNLYVPLRFWFCRNPGLALPLIALQYHEVKLNIEFNTALTMVQNNGTATISSLTTGSSFTSCSLWVDYVYLDTDERRRFAQISHEYLIEQVQHTGTETIAASATSKKVTLNYNHPVKSLHWVMVDTAYTTSGATHTANKPLTYSSNNAASSTNTDGDTFTDMKLQLNGHDRFAVRPADYFRLVQNYQHHTCSPRKHVYTYSFALKPDEHQPSGTCNFSRIDNATMNFSFNSTDHTATALGLKVFAVNYNVLRIMSGMGGLAYSN